MTFHTSLNAFMRHGFETLRNCYVIFVDWHALARWVRDRVTSRKLGGDAREMTPPVRSSPAAAPVLGVRHVLSVLSEKRVAGVALVGGALLAANVWAGAMRMMDAWPIACYPLFDGLIGESYTTLQIKMVADDGTERTLDPYDYRRTFRDRWTHLLARILDVRDEERRRELLRLVWDVMAREDPSLARNRHIRFYTVRSWIRPEQWDRPPGDPELIYDVTL